MYAININGEDFTDRLLTGNPESGLSNLSRSVEDEEDFSPVASTVDVALSDLDGKVSDFLHLPDLMELNAAPDGNLPSFHVEIFDDDGKFFGGYIEPETFGGCPLNAENPDEESVVRFTVADYTKHYFKQLEKEYWTFPNFVVSNSHLVLAGGYKAPPPPYTLDDEASIARYNEDIARYWPAGMQFPWWYYIIDNYVEIVPVSDVIASITGTESIVGSEFSQTYISWTILATLWAQMLRGRDMESKSALLLDLAKALFAVMFIDDDGRFNFVRRDTYMTGRDPAIIEQYSVIQTTPSATATAEYIHDLAWIWMQTEHLDASWPFMQRNADSPRATCWYYFDSTGALQYIFGDAQQPYGRILDAIPRLASSTTVLEYLYLFWLKRGEQFYPGLNTIDEKTSLIKNLLLAKPQMKVSCPGIRFYPGQSVVINGIEGWRILSANIEPMEEESEILLEYRGKQQ